ncbi:MAG TPA: histidine kinase dimerization/phospho-acceptor domain-containing protein, partial [Longimicrobium sp.]|nr:histidine kinase dimerization/phospho-acceptor domain-containing protein [Longimicrobium sp.]
EGGRQLLRALRHELNNPLAAVLGYAQLLEADPAVRGFPHVHQSVRAIVDESRRMNALTGRLAVLETSDDARLLDERGFLRLPRDGDGDGGEGGK